MAIRETVQITVTEKGAVQVKRTIEDIGKGAETSNKGLDMLKRTLGALFAGFSIAKYVQISDAFTNMSNKVKLLSKDTENYEYIMGRLNGIARDSRVSWEGVTDIYQKMNQSTKLAAMGQEKMLGLTDTISKAMIVSGASAQQAASALTQLGQAFTSGTLSGDEFKAISENMPYFLDLIAKGANLPREALKKLGSEGKLTATVIAEAFTNMSGTVNEKFRAMDVTIGQALQVLKDSVMGLTGIMNQTTGASTYLAQAILFLADNIDTVALAVTTLAGVAGLLKLINMVKETIVVMKALNAVLWANPWAILAAAIGAVILIVIAYRKEIAAWIKDFSESHKDAIAWVRNLWNVSTKVFSDIVDGWKLIIKWAVDFYTTIKNYVVSGWTLAKNSYQAMYDFIMSTWNNLVNSAAKAFTNIKNTIVAFVDATLGVFRSWYDTIIGWIEGAINRIKTLLSYQKQAANDNKGGTAAPKAAGFKTGGSFVVGGTGGPDSQLVRFFATPGERVTVETPEQQRQSATALLAGAVPSSRDLPGGGGGSAGGGGATNTRTSANENDGRPVVKIVNVLDPNNMLDVLNTDAGRNVIMNAIASDRQGYQRILGIA